MTFLTSHASTRAVAPTDKQFIVAQIRKHLLSAQSAEAVEKFELLYSKLEDSVGACQKSVNDDCILLVF